MVYLAGDTGMRPGEYLALPRFNLGKTEVKVDRAVERSGLRLWLLKRLLAGAGLILARKQAT